MVIDDPTTWSFDELRDRANSLLDQSRTAVERGRARQLANKIARFEDIKQRQEEVLAMRDRTDRSSRLYAKLRPRDDADFGRSAAKSDIDDRFDGVGQLTQVVAPKVGAPRYALVDKFGQRPLLRHARPGRQSAPLHRPRGRRHRHPRLHARRAFQPHHGPPRHAVGRLDRAAIRARRHGLTAC